MDSGLEVVYENSNGNTDIDIVLVHGLTGHPRKTWTSEGIFWPSEFLPISIPTSRIMTFGYRSEVKMSWTEDSFSIAGRLLFDLAHKRDSEQANHRPLVFLAHSLGGVILERCLILSATSPTNVSAVYESTSGIIFFSTPQIGSNDAKWSRVLNTILNVLQIKNQRIRIPVEDLNALSRTQSEFYALLRERNEQTLQISCLYETSALKPIGIVVDQVSATLPGVPSYAMEGNHISMTKFPGIKDSNYRIVEGTLLSMMNEAPKVLKDLYEEVRGNPNADEQEQMLAEKVTNLIDKGNFEEAEEVQRIMVERRTLVYGSKDLGTLHHSSNLGSILWRQGRLAQAEEVQAKVVESYETILGSMHQDTWAAKLNLASTHLDQGRVKEAASRQREVYDDQVKELGISHPTTLISLNNLAVTYSKQGRVEEAEARFREILEHREREFGLKNPDTITSLSNLAGSIAEQHRYQEAEKLQLKAVELSSRIFGDEHPSTLNAKFDYANTLFATDRIDEAEKLQLEVMVLAIKSLGPEHPQTLQATSALARIYSAQSKFSAAENLQRRVFVSTNHIGTDNITTAKAAESLAAILAAGGKFAEAISTQQLVVNKLSAALGPKHRVTATAKTVLDDILNLKKSRAQNQDKSKLVAVTSAAKSSGNSSMSLGASGSSKTTANKSGNQETKAKIETWVWSTCPSYRLRRETFEDFLTELFGHYEFYIQHSNDAWKAWIPRALTDDEVTRVLDQRDIRDIYGVK